MRCFFLVFPYDRKSPFRGAYHSCYLNYAFLENRPFPPTNKFKTAATAEEAPAAIKPHPKLAVTPASAVLKAETQELPTIIGDKKKRIAQTRAIKPATKSKNAPTLPPKNPVTLPIKPKKAAIRRRTNHRKRQ